MGDTQTNTTRIVCSDLACERTAGPSGYCAMHRAVRQGHYEAARQLGWTGPDQPRERWGNRKAPPEDWGLGRGPLPTGRMRDLPEDCPSRAQEVEKIVEQIKARKHGGTR